MSDEIHLRVWVPRNRNFTGFLRVEVNGRPVHEMPVLARGSRGPGDTQFLNNGNTPTGTYDGSVFQDTSDFPVESYGAYGAIRLDPTDGNALIAEEIFGRSGFLIHGGTLGGEGYWRGAGQLRATYGCLRVSDENMRILRNYLFQDTERAMTRRAPPKVVVTVQE